MDLQILISFIVGGAIVAMQSIIAEKLPSKISGIVIALPSTIIVNFFFLGTILSKADFAKILALIPAPLGASMIFIITYIYIAKWLNIFFFSKNKISKKQKIILIILTLIPSSAVWLLMSLPLAVYKFHDFPLSLMIFIVLAFVAQLVLNRGSKKYHLEEPIRYTVLQQISRAAVAGLVVAITVYLGKTMGPFWGGVIAMFPAAFLAAICIMHYYYSHEALFNFFRTVPLGTSTLILYAWIAHYSFPILGPSLGTLTCIVISFAYSLFLSTRPVNHH